jgi:aminopeptidase N
VITALRTVLSDESLDQAMVAEMLSLPGEAYLTEISEVADVEAIHIAREFARQQLAEAVVRRPVARYQANRECRSKPRMWPRPSTSPAVRCRTLRCRT